MKRKSRLVIKERVKLDDDAFADLMIWDVPDPVRGSAHGYKYGLA